MLSGQDSLLMLFASFSLVIFFNIIDALPHCIIKRYFVFVVFMICVKQTRTKGKKLSEWASLDGKGTYPDLRDPGFKYLTWGLGGVLSYCGKRKRLGPSLFLEKKKG